jgi:hypothetical protein
MVGIFLSDISEVEAPFVGHFEEGAFSLVTQLFELLVTLDLWHGVRVERNIVSNVEQCVLS